MSDLTLISLNIGEPRKFDWRGKTVETAIIKTPVFQSLVVTAEGLSGDHQMDRKNHGGPDKAMLVIPAINYARFGIRKHWGFLGENLTFPCALDENQIRLGDHFQIGEVLLEVTQPRSPCWKLDELAKQFTGKTHFLQTYANSGHVGYYVRVLKTGAPLQAGLSVTHQPTEQPAPTIRQLFLAKHAGGKTVEHRAIIEQALAHPALSAAWQKELNKLLSN
jgi:MOSC domain-containing protein YiiM